MGASTADNARSQMLYPNGTKTTYGYDVRERLTNLTTIDVPGGGSVVQSYAYTLE